MLRDLQVMQQERKKYLYGIEMYLIKGTLRSVAAPSSRLAYLENKVPN